MSQIVETDVLIVGAGPIGLELAVALTRAGIRYVQLDAGPIGSTISWFAPHTHFFSSPERIEIAKVPLQTLDQTKATREEYLAYLRSVVLQFNLQVETFERVTSIRKGSGGLFEVSSSRGERHREWRAKKVVLAIGDMHRPRKIGVPGEDLPHVSHYFEDPHVYFRRHVVVVGGKNSAVEAAIRCARVGADVTLSYRGSELDSAHIKFWLLPEILGLFRDKRARFLPGTVVRAIEPDRVLFTNGESVFADTVLLLTGYEQDKSLFEQAGITLSGPGRKPEYDEATMETNVAGLFVAGTAVAGTQSGGVRHFIETSHVHVDRIVAAMTGARAPREEPSFAVPES